MKKNKALTYLFNRIYNSGMLTNLIVPRETIKTLNNFYKKNFEKTSNYEMFLNNMGYLFFELEKSKSAMAEFQKQFNRRMALQPAILSECFIAQTLANKFELDSFIDADEKQDNIPLNLLNALIRSKGGELEATLPRYIYYSDRKGIVLLQYGDSSSIDAVFVKDGYRVRLEIKEEKAKLGEYDLNYDEDGMLIPTNNILNYHCEYLYFIDKFNSITNVFEYAGKNFKIGSYLNEELVTKIVSSVFNTKKIDIYILQNKDIIFPVTTDKLLDCVDFNKGSEIRTTGRNSYDVFTPNRLYKFLIESGASVNDEIVTLEYCPDKESKGRGKETVTRYKLNSLFFVNYSDINIKDGKVEFALSKVKQNKATISIHLYSLVNKVALEELYNQIVS